MKLICSKCGYIIESTFNCSHCELSMEKIDTTTLFYREDIRKLYNEMRRVNVSKYEETINVSEPGYFGGNGVLFCGQNPGILKPDRVAFDKFLIKEDISDEDFHEYYKRAQLSWKFYDYIKLLIGNSMDFSIINPVFFPTKNNQVPSAELIEECSQYFKRAIEFINPKIIVCLSNISRIQLKSLELDKKYKVIYTPHYAYLFRQSQDFINKEIDKIKNELDSDPSLDIPYPKGHNWEGLTPRQVNRAYSKP